MGNPDENPMVPYRMNYITMNDTENVLNRTTYECNEAYEVIYYFTVN